MNSPRTAPLAPPSALIHPLTRIAAVTYRVGHTISSLAEGRCIPGSGTGRGQLRLTLAGLQVMTEVNHSARHDGPV
jgi:hypothetical protein